MRPQDIIPNSQQNAEVLSTFSFKATAQNPGKGVTHKLGGDPILGDASGDGDQPEHQDSGSAKQNVAVALLRVIHGLGAIHLRLTGKVVEIAAFIFDVGHGSITPLDTINCCAQL
jgi:hypothetical protein